MKLSLKLAIVVALVALLFAALLPGCNMVEGAGKDISAVSAGYRDYAYENAHRN